MGRFFSPIHSNIWTDPQVTQMDVNTNLVRMYLLTNHHGNGAGFYHFNIAYGAADLNISVESFEASLETLVEQGYVMYNPETKALLIRDWFEHNSIGSSKNAQHFVALHDQKRLPQNEPEMELEFFRNLVKAAEDKEDLDSFIGFFNFISRNLSRLDPDAPVTAVREVKKEPTGFDVPFGEGKPKRS